MPRTRWEYLTVVANVRGFLGPKVNINEIGAAFNSYGADGWELVSAFDVNRGEGVTSEIVAFFKRPLE